MLLYDEYSNEDLERCLLNRSPNTLDITGLEHEYDRVQKVIRNHVLTGMDLSYFFERANLLNEILERKGYQNA